MLGNYFITISTVFEAIPVWYDFIKSESCRRRMLMPEQFIQHHFLKKGEVLDKIEQDGELLVLHIMKKTARTYRKVAQFKITAQAINGNEIPEKLYKYHFTLKVKRKIDESNEQIQRWLQQGWIVREIRFNSDGISVSEEHYRIGPAYVKSLERKQLQLEERHNTQMQQLLEKAQQLKLPDIFQQAIDWDKLPEKWTNKKRMKYIEFCLALYELSQQKELFDFKEIGANLHDTIGGSKYFDAEREVFLTQLEHSGIDASFYGLVSIGKIVPIYFTGNVRNDFSTYSIGAVHATTDNAVLLSPFVTTNTTLWLVENRAILTRMAVETAFLQQTNSCVICLDGQIRSAHRLFIEQLLQSNIKQTIIWTDTDAAGVTIAKHAAKLVNGPFKIVGRDFELYQVVDSYAHAHEQNVHEQEQQLGGVAEWMKWV